ncbi:MAG: succinylglutamate desuccinylase/aspartoacylase family protein, partial [Victivallales bacterium]|nr:succinylglutamate desuccinylase/aspartoacylase family protein [Victivallales bacterium]
MSELKTHQKKFRTVDGKDFGVTYFELRGSRPGPTLSVIGGQHGSEHSGPILLTKVVDELKNVDFAGTVKICPAANPPALSIDFYYYPEDKDISEIDDYHYSLFDHHHCPWGLTVDNRYNMSNAWNQKVGGYVGEVTDWLWEEMMDSANVIIDMHCLQAEKPLSFIYNPKAARLAAYFGVEAIHLLGKGEENGNLLYQGCVREKQYCFCVEYGKQHGIRQSEYQLGRDGVFNLMKTMEMISGDVVLNNPVYLIGNENHDILAESAGHPYYV